jgi:hypothetical protein
VRGINHTSKKDLVVIDGGISDEEMSLELGAIPGTEFFQLEPHGAEGEVEMVGQFNQRELLLLALWLDRAQASRPKRIR